MTISSDSGPDPFRPLSCNSDRRRSSRSSSKIIDLTADSPPLASMAKRKLTGAAATAHAAKRQRLVAAKSRPTSRASTDAPSTKIEILDLIDVENYESHETQQKRAQREKEALAVQMAKEEAEKPVRLAEIECVICLDNPTDLVVTHCGKATIFATSVPTTNISFPSAGDITYGKALISPYFSSTRA